MADGSSPRPKRIWLYALAVMGIVLLAVVSIPLLFPAKQPQGRRPPLAKQQLSAAEYALLEQLKNQAIGHLENGQLARADAPLAEIADKLPDEDLGPRNLTIVRLLALELSQVPPEQAQAAAKTLLEREPKSAVAHVLAGKVSLEISKPEQAILRLAEASRLASKDPAVWYELYAAAKGSSVAAQQDQARQALFRAYEPAPNNLFLLAELLLVQAETQDPQFAATLASASAAVSPIAASVQQNRADLLQYLADAQRAAEAGQWSDVLRNVRILANLIRPQPAAQSDRLQIAKNPLEYVLYDFSPQFQAKHPDDGSSGEAAIPVQLRLFPTDDTLKSLTGVSDLQLADFNLDGQLDLSVVRGTALEVYARQDLKGPWQKAATYKLPDGYSRLTVADLDADAPETARPVPPAENETSEPPASRLRPVPRPT